MEVAVLSVYRNGQKIAHVSDWNLALLAMQGSNWYERMIIKAQKVQDNLRPGGFGFLAQGDVVYMIYAGHLRGGFFQIGTNGFTRMSEFEHLEDYQSEVEVDMLKKTPLLQPEGKEHTYDLFFEGEGIRGGYRINADTEEEAKALFELFCESLNPELERKILKVEQFS